ncbi:substrate-binding periplasmic protein [Aestuariispira insulae]|uniref:ABC-type amino acid transport substrate-binding protein n=1 Tax=Aestuariispira insulae TaxID=1461337 RepID=A0A3D9H9Y7_9PROT|nr:transporter substrate-binding domain-containing protein [Aestuariispira insulae]RED45766.1 ABC-type amino acid transport substrate-binding protein [Aestuariispira insulae]
MHVLAGFALCLLLSTLHAKADNAPTLAVIDFFPFGYRDQSGTPKGMFFDMTEAIANDSGIKIDARLMPVPRALRDASNGQVDMLISYKDPLMVPNVVFIGNVGCLTANVIPARNSDIKSMEDLSNRRIGTISGGYFQKRFRDKIAYQEVSVPSNQAMLKMLVRQRLDGFVINSAVYDAFYFFESPVDLPKNWRDHVAEPIRIDILETHLSIAMNSPALEQASKITTSINRLRQNGTMADIFARYGSRDRGNCIPAEFR